MKPFLFLGIRAEDDVADNEYAAVVDCAGLALGDVRRIRLERESMGDLDLDDLSGIILGGGPFNISDPDDLKSDAQLRAERELRVLAERVVETDFPFLGACYGIGVLGTLGGGVVDRTHGEPIGSVAVTLTDAGRDDPLFATLPATFDVFLGHKEAVTRLPDGAVLLASSASCPVQAFRIGSNVYATQFHPELDIEALCLRIEAYRDHGYFEPDQAQSLQDLARRSVVVHPPQLLTNFVERYGS